MKKTIVVLANGFGIESNTSTYSMGEDKTPTIIKLNNEYLSTTLLASGKDVCFSPKAYADFQTGYRAFSTTGKVKTAEKIMDEALEKKQFFNQVMLESIDYAVKNNSKLHIFFPLGDKISHTSTDHLKEFIKKANELNVKEILIHLILGFNSDSTSQYAKEIIKVINRSLESQKAWSIATVTGINNISDYASVEFLAKYYRINTTTVAEVWSDLNELLTTRYKAGISEENIAPFLTSRRLIYEDRDSFFVFNYEHISIEKYLNMMIYPEQVFSYGFLAKDLKIASLFPISASTKLPASYQYSLPEVYFSKLLENYDKKVTVITDEKRAPYIISILNGYREASPKLEFKVVKIVNSQMPDVTSILFQEIQNGQNELIIADLNLLDNYKKNEVSILENNLRVLDQQILAIFNKTKELNHSLIITSLYGLKEEIQMDHKKYLINFSQKVPFIMVDNVKSKNTAFASGTTINDLASTIFNHLAIPGFASFIVSRSKGGKKAKLIYAILIILIAVMLFFTLFK